VINLLSPVLTIIGFHRSSLIHTFGQLYTWHYCTIVYLHKDRVSAWSRFPLFFIDVEHSSFCNSLYFKRRSSRLESKFNARSNSAYTTLHKHAHTIYTHTAKFTGLFISKKTHSNYYTTVVLSWTTIVVHNRDRLEIFQNSLIECTPKAAFRALNLSIKHYRPFQSDLKTDQEVLKAREAV